MQWDLKQELLFVIWFFLSKMWIIRSSPFTRTQFVFFLQHKLWIHSFSISVLCKHIFPRTSIFQYMEGILQVAHPWSRTDCNKPFICRSLKSQTMCFLFYVYSKTTTPWPHSNRTSNPRSFTADFMYLYYNSHMRL